MWDGYVEALVEYGVEICDEWIRRGYKDNCRERIIQQSQGTEIVYPSWFGDPEFHASHRSNLLRKAPVWYSIYEWTESSKAPYIWPVPSLSD